MQTRYVFQDPGVQKKRACCQFMNSAFAVMFLCLLPVAAFLYAFHENARVQAYEEVVVWYQQQPEFLNMITPGAGDVSVDMWDSETSDLPGALTLWTLAVGMFVFAFFFYRRTHKMKRENARLIEAIEATPNGIMIGEAAKENCPVIFANDACCRLLERERQDILEGGWDRFVENGQWKEEEKERLLHAMQRFEPVVLDWSEDVQDAYGKMSRIWRRLQLSPVRDKEEQPDLYIGIVSDYTEAKIQELRFVHMQKLEVLGQLSGGIAHDFNNVLSIVDGYVRMIEKELSDPDAGTDDEDMGHYLERIRQAVARGSALTRQLLTFGRHKDEDGAAIESVHDDLNIVDLGAVVSEQKMLLKPLLNAAVQMTVNVGEGLYVECPADDIGRMLMNLVTNARDAMPDGGTIFVEALLEKAEALQKIAPIECVADEYVVLKVMDTGQGMDRKTQARIFDPFFTTKEEGKGTGLGLSMVYDLVRQASGFVHVESEPGCGTAFFLCFPRSDFSESDLLDAGGEERKLPKKFKGLTVLVAEDEPELLELFSGMLGDMGLNVIGARDGGEALIKQDEYRGKIDLLLTDMDMPDVDGLKLVQFMEQERPETKVIMMSGYPGGESAVRDKLPLGARFLPKPVDCKTLCKAMEEQLINDGVPPAYTLSGQVKKGEGTGRSR